jgi:hypothetical protein
MVTAGVTLGVRSGACEAMFGSNLGEKKKRHAG